MKTVMEKAPERAVTPADAPELLLVVHQRRRTPWAASSSRPLKAQLKDPLLRNRTRTRPSLLSHSPTSRQGHWTLRRTHWSGGRCTRISTQGSIIRQGNIFAFQPQVPRQRGFSVQVVMRSPACAHPCNQAILAKRVPLPQNSFNMLTVLSLRY